MDDNSDNNRTRLIVTGTLILLAALVYLMVKDIRSLKPAAPPPLPPHASQTAPAAAVSHEIALGFRVSGRIDRMLAAEHAQVKQGELLATLDRAPFEQALAYAKAQLDMAQAQYRQSTHIPNETFHAIEAARANVETAQHTYDVAAAELEKHRALVIGQTDNVYNDDVQNEHDAELNLQRMRRELAQLESEAGSANAEADKAAIEAARAGVAIAETNLADTQLLAPALGTIASRVSEPGADVQAGATVYTLSASPGN